MNEMQVFEREEFGQIRTVTRDGEPWFVAADVCRVLEVQNVSKALNRLDDDEKMTLTSSEGHSGQRGGAQVMNIVNEPGLYTLVLGSRKPEAKAFKRWITHEVLPSIRKTGAYATDAKLMEAAKLIATCEQPTALPALIALMSEYTGVPLTGSAANYKNQRFDEMTHVRNWIESMCLTTNDLLSEPRDTLYARFLDWVSLSHLSVSISMKSFCSIVRSLYGFSSKPLQASTGKRYFKI